MPGVSAFPPSSILEPALNWPRASAGLAGLKAKVSCVNVNDSACAACANIKRTMIHRESRNFMDQILPKTGPSGKHRSLAEFRNHFADERVSFGEALDQQPGFGRRIGIVNRRKELRERFLAAADAGCQKVGKAFEIVHARPVGQKRRFFASKSVFEDACLAETLLEIDGVSDLMVKDLRNPGHVDPLDPWLGGFVFKALELRQVNFAPIMQSLAHVPGAALGITAGSQTLEIGADLRHIRA